MHKTSIFIFRRDLRLDDNTGLIAALKASEKVLPVFIFDPRQVDKNPYRGDHCVQFLIESLKDLEGQLKDKGGKLYLFYGRPDEVIAELISEVKADAVFLNRDYTQFSQQRDLQIKEACSKSGAGFIVNNDYLLNEPEDIRKNDGGVYTVYTPFFKKARDIEVDTPVRNLSKNYFTGKVKAEAKKVYAKVLKDTNDGLAVHGGRHPAQKVLKQIKRYKNYDDERNIPSIEGTSRLSAHHKFGTVSIREVYHAICSAFNKDHTMISELYWRDFFTHVGFHYPHVLGEAFQQKYSKLDWSTSKKDFKAWCDGVTGFPIVDAGMRELNTTGYMHNRVRMITASFLVKDLHIDWRWGEKYFAQKLIDYDPLVNNGNWQWAASTGCDAQPYFRIFNPWRQQERFDPECIYIKKWVPELKKLDPKEIHKWETNASPILADYSEPMVEHKEQSQKAKEMFKVL